MPGFAKENQTTTNGSDLEYNSIKLLTDGQHFTTKQIQIISTRKKADVNYNILDGFGNILYEKSLIIDGNDNPLLCTFEDSQASLSLAKTKCKNIIKVLSIKYNLNELNNNNWKSYMMASDNTGKAYGWIDVPNGTTLAIFS